MKYLVFIIALTLFSFQGATYAQKKSSSELAKEIQGTWKLISFEKEAKKVDYSNRDIEWSFDGKNFSVMSDDLKGRIKGKYQFRRSIFRTTPTYILKCSALTKTHLAHGKLVLKEVNDTKLVMVDWEDKVTYVLQKK